jgi:hypothetical protein
MTRGRAAAVLALLVVVAAVIAGLRLAGSPAQERARRLDRRRLDDLAAISRAIDVYHERHRRMPNALADLTNASGPEVTIADPSTGQAYEYRVTEGKHYELCATFAGASRDQGYADLWAHGAGRQCFPLGVREVTR